jgi:general secretion pathway protein D
LNLLLVRDTAEVLALVDKLIATIDLPEPEVVLDVEVLEVASDRVDSIGLSWPETLSLGVLGVAGDGSLSVPAIAATGERQGFRGWVANPALVATLKGSSGAGTLIANPSIRVRNHEKARVLVGDKLPVFTTTSTANVGVSSSVSYLDVGLKLDIEPSVHLGNEVAMRVSLEVSNLIKEVTGPSGSVAYQIGTRMASTALRLKDGETQVLAGLINDDDRRRAVGVPGLSTLPVVGALFGVQSDNRSKTEIVLLITPRVVRGLAIPPPEGLLFDAGNDANPGAAPLRLGASARGATAMVGGAPGAALADTPAVVAPAAVADAGGRLRLSGSSGGKVGALVSVTLFNDSLLAASGVLAFDAGRLQPASAGPAPDGRLPFELAARAEKVLVLRLLPLSRGEVVPVAMTSVSAKKPDGSIATLAHDSEINIEVEPE